MENKKKLYCINYSLSGTIFIEADNKEQAKDILNDYSDSKILKLSDSSCDLEIWNNEECK